MKDMRELLSGALPAPQDEPQQRDVIDAAMGWGTRRRRRDWALSGAAALAVLAVATGIAAMSGGSGNGASPAGGPRPSASATVPGTPDGSYWTASCGSPGSPTKSPVDKCGLFTAKEKFNVDFAQGSVPFIQAALPAGFTVKSTDSWVLILTGPNGKTNYLFPSAEPASTLDGRPLSCGTPAPPGCVETSTAGGTLVVNGGPSGQPSAGYVGVGIKDPRVDILVGTSVEGGMNGIPAPTAAESLLSQAQLEKILSSPGFLTYAKSELQYLKDITQQLQGSAPSSSSQAATGFPSSAATDSWSSPSGATSSP